MLKNEDKDTVYSILPAPRNVWHLIFGQDAHSVQETTWHPYVYRPAYRIVTEAEIAAQLKNRQASAPISKGEELQQKAYELHRRRIYEEAERLYNEALTILKQEDPPNHRAIAATLNRISDELSHIEYAARKLDYRGAIEALRQFLVNYDSGSGTLIT